MIQADAFRVWTSLGVVWFHSIESPALQAAGVVGRFSVAFYTALGMVLVFESLRSRPGQTFADFAGRRLRRLYLPFLGWSALTGVALFLLHVIDWQTPLVPLRLGILVRGTAEPLWFVPFFLIASGIVFCLAKCSAGRLRREITLAIACGIAALCLDLIPWNAPPLQSVPLVGPLLEGSWNRWSAVYWGVVVAVCYRRWFMGRRWLPLIAAAGIAATAGAGAYQWCCGIVPALKVAGGIGLTLAGLCPSQSRFMQRSARWAPLTFGIYLAHPLWIAAARAAANLVGTPISWERDVLVFVIAAIASVLSVHALARHRALCWLVGGKVEDRPRERPQAAATPVA